MSSLAVFLNRAIAQAQTEAEIADVQRALDIIDEIANADDDEDVLSLFSELCAIKARFALAEAAR